MSFGVQRAMVLYAAMFYWDAFIALVPSGYYVLFFLAWIIEVLAVCAALELDCVFRVQARRESQELRGDFSGNVMDASCAEHQDSVMIKSEIRSNGQEEKV